MHYSKYSEDDRIYPSRSKFLSEQEGCRRTLFELDGGNTKHGSCISEGEFLKDCLSKVINVICFKKKHKCMNIIVT